MQLIKCSEEFVICSIYLIVRPAFFVKRFKWRYINNILKNMIFCDRDKIVNGKLFNQVYFYPSL